MSSLEEFTPREVSKKYDIPYSTLTSHIHDKTFPARKFDGKWLIDVASEEFQAYAAQYGQNPLVRARREGRLRKCQPQRVPAMPSYRTVLEQWTMFVPAQEPATTEEQPVEQEVVSKTVRKRFKVVLNVEVDDPELPYPAGGNYTHLTRIQGIVLAITSHYWQADMATVTLDKIIDKGRVENAQKH